MKKELPIILCGILSAIPALASEQSQSKGFIADSHFNLLLRNAYMKRDYKVPGIQNRAEWGQGLIADWQSGYTRGLIGFGFDAMGQYAVRLDGGRGKSGDGGIDFFKQAHNGKAKSELAKFGATAKMRISDTVISYGTQRPQLPVVSADNSRLLDETFTGVVVTSKEIHGLDINAGYLTDEQRKSDDRHNSGLKSLSFGGASYQFNDRFSGSFYASNVEKTLNKQYLGLSYQQPLAAEQSLALNFNGYNSRLTKKYASQLDTGRSNTIWSMAANYSWWIHTFKLAYQQSNGSTGYQYAGYRDQGGVGDGGNSIWLDNSYWSDFDAKGERSWQAAYGIDFSELGIPGLSYNIAYVRGDNIKTSQTSNGHEHELYNQIQYKVQSGVAKDLTLDLRYSILRVSANAADYNSGGSEIRFFADYPFSFF
ncbi:MULTISPECIES: OprD family outer membrane porin [Tatumella]|uniref:OprD family outer membrane porin n=1 Tax=Tatumella punctata TaxID=399969 RepID=A0ABW1VNS9_9GAMM|nr:OprD family outer membrane porin [Tatumella sp. JGM16]MBS0877524.1 OprD family outer membrane porin [Tatumella sp. JGM82]MBS0891123.1 OprD family outer membrane porin [Tatumella sp. JGM94]MBS0894003.1 OprD family outer membrane porin [Tatumella sp. JGM130]MBS0902056.1 OprD family outer membrane porin [Tatumella sp. JGM100]MBS0913149.1 OprD family outer membrane porin [Tatumella sp. JGM91]